MKVTLKQVDGAKISLVFALSFALMILFFLPFLLIVGLILKNDLSAVDFVIFVFLPIIYFILTYISSRIFFGVFNIVIKKYNGIEFTVSEIEKDEN